MCQHVLEKLNDNSEFQIYPSLILVNNLKKMMVKMVDLVAFSREY